MKTFEDFGISLPTNRTSGQVKTFCPQCHSTRKNKSDRSLSVDIGNGVWKCHYCGWTGTINGGSHGDNSEGKLSWYNPHRIRKQKPVYKKPPQRATSPISEKALAWFKGRGISFDTLTACKVTEGQEFMPQKNGQANTVQFNYYLKGELVNTKFRTGDKCFKLCQGAQLIPYMIDNIKGQSECIVTEGEMDALSFYEIGFHNVISVPNGANANLDYLDDFIEDYFDDKETIYIASDTDTKGVVLRDELIRRFGAERCRVLEYGKDCKDANEHLMKYGAESLRKALQSAAEIKLEGIFQVSDFEESLDVLFESGMQRGVTIGHEGFDKLCSFETKRLLTVTGIPGSGKSEFIDEIAERLNMRYGWRFAYFSPENSPLAYHASKLIEKFTGKRFCKDTLTFGEYKQVKQHLETNFFFISPQDDYRLETILERAKFLVRRKGIKALVIDPYNRLEDESNGLSETRYISRQLDRLTNFAQQNDVLVILMAHPTKQPKNKDGVIEAPTLYDISGSAHFYNKTDFGVVVHRNRLENTVDVIVQKVKFRHLGTCGTATFRYNLNNGRYVDVTSGGEPVWDNSNHIVEEAKQREQEASNSAQFDWEDTKPIEGCPF